MTGVFRRAWHPPLRRRKFPSTTANTTLARVTTTIVQVAAKNPNNPEGRVTTLNAQVAAKNPTVPDARVTTVLVQVAVTAASAQELTGTLLSTGATFPLGTFLNTSTEQEGFRWRSDGTEAESPATWAAAQDTNINITKETPRGLRFLINATGDPASTAYKLQYRKVGDPTWEDMA